MTEGEGFLGDRHHQHCWVIPTYIFTLGGGVVVVDPLQVDLILK